MRSIFIAALTSSAMLTLAAVGSAPRAQEQEKSSATIVDTATILGMTLGKPFAIPRCPGTELDVLKRGPDGPTETCWTPSGWPNETASQKTVHVWVRGQYALSITNVWANIHNSKLDSLILYTPGIRNQDHTLSMLTTKFGKPFSFEEVPYQNALGAKFVGYEANWHTQSVDVHFNAVETGKLDQGIIQILLARSYEEKARALEQWQRNRPKF